MRSAFIFTALLCFMTASIAMADDPDPATQPSWTIMTYDISDLLRNTSDYPLSSSSLPQFTDQAGGRSFALPGGGPPQPNPAGGVVAADSVTPQSIYALVKQMVPVPDNFVAVVGHMIILQAPDDLQAKVQALLNSMHQQEAAASAMVCARVFWISLTPAEVASIFDQVKMDDKTKIAPMPTIPDSMIDATHLYCQAQTICFSGQTVHVVSGRSQSYISSVTPVVGSSTVGYQPTVSDALSGVTVQLKPQLVSNGMAVVDIASMVNESGAKSRNYAMSFDTGIKPTSQPTQEQGMPPMIETPNIVQQEFHTTVRLPVGKKILIGGMTLEPAAKDQAGRQLFLAMEVDAVQ